MWVRCTADSQGCTGPPGFAVCTVLGHLAKTYFPQTLTGEEREDGKPGERSLGGGFGGFALEIKVAALFGSASVTRRNTSVMVGKVSVFSGKLPSPGK